MFSLTELQIAAMKPRRGAETLSAWMEHIPFAFFIMAIHKPGLFVELGTHTGASFCAFCQAAEAVRIPTKCYAVDLWTGDEHAGFYGEEVFQDLSLYQATYYRPFSNLLRMSFDEATKYFSDGTIDLLHIDGCHRYEEVRHDFETWLPKMSRRGVILLHDTFVREREFYVRKLLEELKTRYPVFEFTHGFGLGAVAVGDSLQNERIWELFQATGEETVALRLFFSTLGLAISNDGVMARNGEELSRRREELSRLEKELDAEREMRQSMQESVQAAELRVQELQSALHAEQESHKALKDYTSRIEMELNQVRNSLGWKITQYIFKHPAMAKLGLQLRAIAFDLLTKGQNIQKVTAFARANSKIEIEKCRPISVVMLTLNRLSDIKTSLKCLYENTQIPFELIILDNGSDSNVVRYLQEFNETHDNVKLLLEPVNLGASGGRRKAFSVAAGDYIVAIDNDVRVMPYCIANLVKCLEENEKAAGVCCKVVFPNCLIQFNGGSVSIEGSFARFVLMDSFKHFDDPSTMGQYECDWLPGGATIWRKEIINSFELDPEMKGSYEDNEHAYVIGKAGYKLLNCPSAIAVHNSAEFNWRVDRKYFAQRHDVEKIKHSLWAFYKKHGYLIRDDIFYAQAGLDPNRPEQVIFEISQGKQ